MTAWFIGGLLTGLLLGAVGTLLAVDRLGLRFATASWSWDTTWGFVAAVAAIFVALVAGIYTLRRDKVVETAADRTAAQAARSAAVQFRVRKRAERGDGDRWDRCTVTALNMQRDPVFDVELWIAGVCHEQVGDVLLEGREPFHWHNVPLGEAFKRSDQAGEHLNKVLWQTVEIRYSVQGRRFVRRENKTIEIGFD
ncbi:MULTISPECIES: hypothetical protein [unclassified Rathayibacter]|uniref:hypothetical protein n=1 Tax=unclassified Rathayibacter TaxID=2609250 RepID=UPI00105E6DD5|nr:MULTISPECIES: hypothetical protein [unclassified Rathayibacter]